MISSTINSILLKTIQLSMAVLIVLLCQQESIAQSMSVNSNGARPDSSAMLDVQSTSKGLLIPRMTLAQRTAIVNPADGLMVYQTDGVKGVYVYNATSTSWNAENDNLGNHLATENIVLDTFFLSGDGDDEGVFVSSTGEVGIGTTAPTSQLEVFDASSNTLLNITNQNTTSSPILNLKRSRTGLTPVANNDYLGIVQFNGYVGSTYEAGARIRAQVNGATSAGDLPTRLLFETSADGTANPIARMAITNSGDIGIGTNIPDSKLHVVGNLTLTSADTSKIFNSSGASRQMLALRGRKDISTGAGINIYGNGDLLYPRSIRMLVGGDFDAALWVDSNENVAIGNHTPAFRLDVGGVVRADSLVIHDGTNSPSPGDVLLADDASGKSYWAPASSLDQDLAEVLLVDSNAQGHQIVNVSAMAIGHTTPSVELEVQGRQLIRSNSVGQSILRIAKNNGDPTFDMLTYSPAKNPSFRMYDSLGVMKVQITGGGQSTFFDNNDAGMAFGSSTTAGSFNFVDSSAGNLVIQFNQANPTNNDIRFRLNHNGNARWFWGYDKTSGNYRISQGAWTNPLFQIDSATSFFGFGISSAPTTVLAIQGNGAVNPVGITQNYVNGASSMEFTTTDGSGDQATRLSFGGGNNNSDLKFYTGGSGSESQYVHFDGTTERVGIGTTNPGNKLTVLTANTTTAATAAFQFGDATGSAYLGSGSTYTALWDDGGTARLSVLQSNGNVGINTITPSYTLDVNGAARVSSLRVNTTTLQFGAAMEVDSRVNIIGSSNPNLFIGPSGSNYLQIMYNTSSNYAQIFTPGTRDILLSPGGNVGIGTTNPIRKLDVVDNGGYVARFENTQTGITNGVLALVSGATVPGAANSFAIFVNGTNTIIGGITGNGIGGVLYNTTSDRRLKRDIHTLENALELINQLQPRSYERIENPGHREFGFVAQELQLILPQLVSGDSTQSLEEGPMMVDYSKLTPILTKAIQEQQSQIEILKEENAMLRTEIEAMYERIDAVEKQKQLKFISK